MKNKTLPLKFIEPTQDMVDLLADQQHFIDAIKYGTGVRGHSYREMYMGQEFQAPPLFRYPCLDAPRIEDMPPLTKK